MATRLATQRGFITVTPVAPNDQTKATSQSSPVKTELQTDGRTVATAISVTNNGILATQNGNPVPVTLQQVIQQKKIVVQPNGGISLIDVNSLENSDSNDDSPITVTVVEPNTGQQIQQTTNDVTNGSQQLTAQVAVVSPENPGETPHYITVTVSSPDNVNNHHAYVQYVDSEMYTTTGQGQSQMSYPVYAVGDYTSGGQQYYTATSGNYTATAGSQSSNQHYLVPVDEQLLANQQQNRDSPQGMTVSWLVENYETAEGTSLPRSTLYNHYMRHCNENKLDAVNAASFGKLIRSVFTGLRTRRLGTRGNSKYHYYGIRIKPSSSLVNIMEDKPQNSSQSNNYNNNHINSNQGRGLKKSNVKVETYEACAQFLGDGSGAIPIFPTITLTQPFPDDITLDDVDTLRSIYREHCEAFLDAILSLEFSTIEQLWREFWRAQDNNNGDECEEEKYLSKMKLYNLCQCEAVQDFIKQVDWHFYQNMVDVLIPDVLRPIPSSLTQAIRNFAKNLESWLSSAMSGCPDIIVQIKLQSVSAFSQMLRRYTSLNHLAQAARAVLQNSSQIAQMLNDLNRVDFHNVQEQASWVCQCDTQTVQRLENDFKAALQQQNTLEQWAAWLRMVVDNALEEYRGKPSFPKAARQFLLKWSFYSSMVIRDLTLRSAASFGSFHLIRLLYDEYMFFIVEHKVAEATNSTPISVMGDATNHLNNQHSLEDDVSSMLYTNDFEVKMEPSAKRMRS